MKIKKYPFMLSCKVATVFKTILRKFLLFHLNVFVFIEYLLSKLLKTIFEYFINFSAKGWVAIPFVLGLIIVPSGFHLGFE